MAEPFDPYFVWLGIPPEEQPANRYRLLGVPLFVNNHDVIDNAADQRTAHLRTFQSSKNGKSAEQILNEVAAARVCLLDAKKKAAYDQELRAKLAAQSPSPAPIPTQPAASGSAIQLQSPRGPIVSATAKNAPTANRGVSDRNIAIGVGAGVLPIGALAFGIHALKGPPEGTLVFDWPDRADVAMTVDNAPIEIPATGSWEHEFPVGPHRIAAQRPEYKFATDVDPAAGERLSVSPDWKPSAKHDGDEQSARPTEASAASKPAVPEAARSEAAKTGTANPETPKTETPKPAIAKPESLIKIARARWGGGSKWVDVTERVQEAVDHHQTVWASPDFLKKDPTPGWRKHLQITVEKDGHRRTVNLDEGKHWSKQEYETDKKPEKAVAGHNQPAPPSSVATQKNATGSTEPPATAGRQAAPNPAAQPNPVAGQPAKSLESPPQSDHTEISLPGNVTNVAVGGGGRFLILHLAQLRKLAVFDVNEAKIVKYIPLPEDEVCMTAGIDKLIIGLPQANAFQRWSLQTLEREVTVPNPLKGGITDVRDGKRIRRAASGELRRANFLLNPRTFREMNTRPADRRLPSGAPGLIRASADGTLFVMAKAVAAKGIRWVRS